MYMYMYWYFQVFQKLDGSKTGLIKLTDMHKFFNGHAHPEVQAGRSSPEEVWFVLFGYLGTRDQPAISYAVSRLCGCAINEMAEKHNTRFSQ